MLRYVLNNLLFSMCYELICDRLASLKRKMTGAKGGMEVNL